MTTSTNATALAARPEQVAPARFNPQDLWPRSWEEVQKLAAVLSKSGMLPKHLQNNEPNTFLSIMAGLELGIAPLVACREIYFVDGKPNVSSLLKVSMVRGSALCEKWQEVKSDNDEAVYAARRVGDKGDTVRRFTFKDAERAGLTAKDNWRKYPAAMLRRRAQGYLADDLFPDLVRGMGDRDDDIAIDEAKEVRWAERVTPPPPPGAYTQPPAEGTPPHDPVTGEVKESPPADDPSASSSEQELSFEALVQFLNGASSKDDLQKRGERVSRAKAAGTLNADQTKLITEVYKAKSAALGTASNAGGGQ